MQIETERLQVVALTPSELTDWIRDLSLVEQKLSCRYLAEPLSGHFAHIIAQQAAIARADSDNYLWHTFWWMIRKSDRTVVGSFDFKTPANAQGQVEIGYGLGSEFEKQGYMTETVRAMTSWALSQPKVKQVIAETYLDGLASQKVLTSCGFSEYSRAETVWFGYGGGC